MKWFRVGEQDHDTGDFLYALTCEPAGDGNLVFTLPHVAITVTWLPIRGEQLEPTIFW